MAYLGAIGEYKTLTYKVLLSNIWSPSLSPVTPKYVTLMIGGITTHEVPPPFINRSVKRAVRSVQIPINHIGI
jgi:hypothetical protein